MLNIGDMIKSRRLDLGLTLEEVGNAVGVSKGTVQKWENGLISNMKIDKIASLSKVLNLNPVSFITEKTQSDVFDELEPYNPRIHEIPILGYIAAGLPLYSEENIEGYTYTERNGGAEYFALRVKGDSMSASRINDGDLLIVRRQPTVENGEIAVVRVNNDSATVKRFKRDKNIVQLIPQSYNPEHQIQIYDLKKDKIDIIGKVVECKTEF